MGFHWSHNYRPGVASIIISIHISNCNLHGKVLCLLWQCWLHLFLKSLDSKYLLHVFTIVSLLVGGTGYRSCQMGSGWTEVRRTFGFSDWSEGLQTLCGALPRTERPLQRELGVSSFFKSLFFSSHLLENHCALLEIRQQFCRNFRVLNICWVQFVWGLEG